MEGRRNSNDIVAEPLTEDSSEDWFEWVKNYLISQDLWEVTNSSARPDENHVEDFAKWRRNNAAALHVILISCGRPNHSHMKGVSEAKDAWDILYDTYNNNAPASAPASATASPPAVITELTEAEGLEMSNMRTAIAENNWSAAKASLDRYPQVLDVGFAKSVGETPLHVAAKFGHLGIVEELLRLVPEEYLEIQDAYYGNTPLATVVSQSELIPVAACLIIKNKKALKIPTKDDWEIPVTSAFYSGHKEMGRYLYRVTPLEVFQPGNGTVGPEFLHAYIALDLLQRCNELLFAIDEDKEPTIQHIARYLSNSLYINQLPFWKRWSYHSYVFHFFDRIWVEDIKIPSTTTTGHFCVDIQQEGESNQAGQGMKKIYEMKVQHAKVLNLVCENLRHLNEEKKKMFEKALISVSEKENVEFLLRVTKADTELITLVSYGGSDISIFFHAVKYRSAEIFNLLRGFRFKNVVASIVDDETSNTLLHVAALLAPSSYLDCISGAALQMQREMQWFKAVKSVADREDRLLLNKDGFRPLEYFRRNHKELRADGEKWMKETASSCSVVGALIVTIMFAAAITVPGGNNQNSGYPMFMKEKLFKVFLISDALSLFSSTTSVLTFLGILTSRYTYEDFLCSLPRKLIIGLSTLFLSIATMMIAFSAAIMIMLQYHSSRLWVILPIPILASIPITLFVLLQFRLLVEVFWSTYGPGLFKKKVVRWP
ncbi:uncharacterized protein LOC114717908 [Neltuma alba]|uniref:uncharacterized protein LOC114717908 n=1 Tax=Neltuma alba TaxID=207710 RepID=UPI0010A44E0D|nr:uncharacterized protein LOC114717908 [Prosopis alba]